MNNFFEYTFTETTKSSCCGLKNCIIIIFFIFLPVIFFSCKSTPKNVNSSQVTPEEAVISSVEKTDPIIETTQPVETKSTQIQPVETQFTQTQPVETKSTQTPPIQKESSIPVKPERTKQIMGKGNVSAEKLTLFLLLNNPGIKREYVYNLAVNYIRESEYEEINHDIAFAQMCLETGFLKFGGLVQPEWNNFCGLGALGPAQPGNIFPDLETGVRAHIQHLKAYATDELPKNDLVDPRYRYVQLGSSPTIDGLAGKWASDVLYAVKINSILQRLYEFSFL